MKRTILFNEFKTILTEHIPGEDNLAIENINEETNLVDDLGIESLDVVNIVTDLEERYKIAIDNDSIRRMSTVGNCLNLIEEKLLMLCN